MPDIDIDGAVAGTVEATTSYTVPWTGEPRDLVVHAWYPTSDSTGTAARWLDAWVDSNSWVDATYAPLPDACKAPLVVYSHGSRAWAGNSTPILRQLVAAGWIAAAPDHTDNLLNQDEEQKPESFPLLRTLDVAATIDWIEGLPVDDPLYGRVDTSRVFVYGHSYGGQTSWLLAGPSFDAAAIDTRCASAAGCTDAERAAFDVRAVDERVIAVAPLDGTVGADLVADAGFADMDRPVLFLSASTDPAEFLRASAGAVTWVSLEGACHESFTATPTPCDLDKTRGLEITATYVSAFATREMFGSTDKTVTGILDGTVVVDESTTLERSERAR
ncbi:MAG: hypothetical protein EXR71_17270 [Myxococcales bacterium]|nr:hypothetical protein [Myxococcales bacterium]